MSNLELRQLRRSSMFGVPERLGLSFSRGSIELRAKPDGTGGSSYEFDGYAAVYDAPFDMWDPWGEPYTEDVGQGACKRSLANPVLDVPFLIGHNDAGIPLARTKSGTMQLAEDTHGLHAHVPGMDGRREEVRALASAVERGDMDEMSVAFVCRNQRWNEDYSHRSVLEMDIHRGDVCAVIHGANEATAGASMRAVEALSYRRPALIGMPLLERRLPTAPYTRGAGEAVTCPQCQSGNDTDARFCDQCGTGLQPAAPYVAGPDETQQCPACLCWNAPDAKVCDQCGTGLVNDHDADDGYFPDFWRQRPVPRELFAQMSTKEINALPDSDFAFIRPGGTKDSDGKTTPRDLRFLPIHDEAHARNALAQLPKSNLTADEQAKARTKIVAACKKFGIEVSDDSAAAGRPLERRAAPLHPPFTGSHAHVHPTYGSQGGDQGHGHQHTHDGDAAHDHHQSAAASARPLARRAAAVEDMDVAAAPDYNPDVHGDNSIACPNPQCPVPGGALNARDAKACDQCGYPLYPDAPNFGTSASVVVDAGSGIPGEEDSLSARRKLERMQRELELEELALH